jgi:cytidylate kinase
MENQPINGSQKMSVKPIILPQSINIMKVDYQSHDDKEECNVVADKGLFKLTNWFLNSGANGHFYYNTDYFIQYERIDENALTVYNENKLPIIEREIIEITVVSPRNRHITFYIINVNHLSAVRLNILSLHALNN